MIKGRAGWMTNGHTDTLRGDVVIVILDISRLSHISGYTRLGKL